MKARVSFLIDIRSESVGACFAEYEDGKTVLSFVKRISVPGGTEELSARTLTALASLLREYGNVPKRPLDIRIFLSGPWYSARLKSVTSAFEQPLRISGDSVGKALAEHRKKHSEPENGVPVESAVSQAYVNGYPSALVRPVRGTNLTVDLYESFADADFIDRVKRLAQETFGGIATSLHSFPFAAFRVLRVAAGEENFLILDVQGELTDFLVARKNSVAFVGSFPYGTRAFLNDLAGNGSKADAATRASLLARGELHAEDARAFAARFERAAAKWKEGYMKLTGSATNTASLPHAIFLYTGREEGRWFTHILSALGEAESRIRMPGADFFQNMLSLGASGSYDPFLCTEALPNAHA